MNEYEKRKQAIKRHQAREAVTSIVKSLGKSRPWFYNWLKRYKADDGQDSWYKDQSRAPKTKPTKVADCWNNRSLLPASACSAKGSLKPGQLLFPMNCVIRELLHLKYGRLTGFWPVME